MLPLQNELVSLLIGASYSWIRMFISLGIAILLGLGIGIAAARSKAVERAIIPIVDVLQTLPILAFFPVVIYVVIAVLPGVIGINAAVIFLIITSMVWNMIFGVYEAVKSIPNEFIEMSRLHALSTYQKIRKIFVPASLPRLSEQMNLSWAIGLFYLVTSEIFVTGNQQYTVQGIGSDIAKLGFGGNIQYYILAIAVFVIFVVATRLTFFSYFDRFANRFSSGMATAEKRRKEDFGYAISRSNAFHVIGAAYSSSRERFAAFLARRKKPLVLSGISLGCAALALVLAYLLLPNINIGDLVQLPGYELTSLAALAASFLRVWGAFALVLAVAVPIAVYAAFLSKHRSRYTMLFQILASIPATILLPIIVSSLGGNGEAVAFTVLFLSGIWYVVFSILASTRNMPSSVDEIRRAFGVRGLNAWKKIFLGAIAPGLITGGITAIAAEWNATIIAERFTSSVFSGTTVTSVNLGIGKLLDTSLVAGNLYLMVIALINMTAMIILLNTFVWKRLYRKVTSVYT